MKKKYWRKYLFTFDVEIYRFFVVREITHNNRYSIWSTQATVTTIISYDLLLFTFDISLLSKYTIFTCNL